MSPYLFPQWRLTSHSTRGREVLQEDGLSCTQSSKLQAVTWHHIQPVQSNPAKLIPLMQVTPTLKHQKTNLAKINMSIWVSLHCVAYLQPLLCGCQVWISTQLQQLFYPVLYFCVSSTLLHIAGAFEKQIGHVDYKQLQHIVLFPSSSLPQTQQQMLPSCFRNSYFWPLKLRHGEQWKELRVKDQGNLPCHAHLLISTGYEDTDGCVFKHDTSGWFVLSYGC